MRSKKSFILWSIWNYAFLAWDAIWAGVAFEQQEWGWFAFFLVFALIMAFCQWLNIQLRQRGKDHERNQVRGFPSIRVPEYSTTPNHTLVDEQSSGGRGDPEAAWKDGFDIELEGDTTLEEALADLGYRLTGESGLPALGEAVLTPDDHTVLIRGDIANLPPGVEELVDQLYKTPVDNEGSTFRILERVPVPAGV